MKKVLCCLLSVLLVLPMIASCANKDNTDNTTTLNKDLNDLTPEELYGKYNLDGQEFVLLIEQRETPYNEFYAEPDVGNVREPSVSRTMKGAQKTIKDDMDAMLEQLFAS